MARHPGARLRESAMETPRDEAGRTEYHRADRGDPGLDVYERKFDVPRYRWQCEWEIDFLTFRRWLRRRRLINGRKSKFSCSSAPASLPDELAVTLVGDAGAFGCTHERHPERRVSARKISALKILIERPKTIQQFWLVTARVPRCKTDDTVALLGRSLPFDL